MPKDDSKVFDVAKPGDSDPQMGSKPMVVGHKPHEDPDVKEAPKEDAPKTKKVKLEPVSDDMKVKSQEKAEEKARQEKPAPADGSTESKSEPEKEKETPKETGIETPKSDSEELDEKTKLQLEREENLQKLIKSKKYNVSIKETSNTNVRTFITTFLIITIVGLVGIAALIDAEILDVGLDLPFDLL